jgi:hypothetical protein
MNNIQILELSQYKAPEAVESTRNEWVEYGDENNHYRWLIDRYRNSATNNAVINNIGRLIYGRGLHAIDAARKPSQYAAMKSLLSSEDLRKVCIESYMLGAGHFQVHYDDKHTKVIKIYHIETEYIRPEKCNEDGDITGYYYSDNWEDVRKYPPRRIPAFGTSKDKIEIYCIKPYSVGMKYFGEVAYQGGLPYAILEEEIADFLINDVQNKFSGTKVVNFNNGIPAEQQQEDISRKVISKLTGSTGQKVIVAFNNNAESKTTIDDIPLDDAPQHYEYLSKEAEQKILISHNVISPMLVGVVTDNQGFSSNADEIEISAKYFHNIAIRPFQDLIIDALDRIFAFNDISLDLFFRRLNLLQELEVEEQKEEEEATVNMSSQLEDILAEFGEDEDEDWELLDSREVNYDEEEELDAQVLEWEKSMQPKKSLLSKIFELVSTGTARGNASSEQDKKVKDKFFKVRYKYTGNPNPERDFCKAMMARENRIFRKEDIDMMSSKIVNAGFGEFGADTYDIFKFKGGPRCHHKWERRTYVSATRSVDVNSPNATTIGTRAAEVKGYTVRNPFEVSIYPNNLPLKGFSPNNKNLPSDVR